MIPQIIELPKLMNSVTISDTIVRPTIFPASTNAKSINTTSTTLLTIVEREVLVEILRPTFSRILSNPRFLSKSSQSLATKLATR